MALSLSGTRAPEPPPPLADAAETGALGIFGLKRLWSQSLRARHGLMEAASAQQRHLDYLIIHASGLGLEQTQEYLAREAPSFEAFERWIVATTGGIAPERVARSTPLSPARTYPDTFCAGSPTSRQARRFFPPTISHSGTSAAMSCCTTRCRRRHARRRRGAVGSSRRPRRRSRVLVRRSDHGIMVQYFQHPAFEANRRCRGCTRRSRNSGAPPTLDDHRPRRFQCAGARGLQFPGPDLHWDCSVKTPIPFGTQGILYLTDTPPSRARSRLYPAFSAGVTTG